MNPQGITEYYIGSHATGHGRGKLNLKDGVKFIVEEILQNGLCKEQRKDNLVDGVRTPG